MLELGGAQGLYSIELCKKYPRLRSSVLDLPPVKKYADECIAKQHAANNVSFVASDFMKDELPKGNDIILAFNIIHGLNPAKNDELAKNVFSS